MLNAHGILGRPFHKTCAYDNINYRVWWWNNW
jgi:ribosome modulation factor